jgi:ribose transport system ATP-binding protein
MESSQLLLRMEQINKHFPGVHALDHVDFDVRAGEVHVLLGENGAGKSTLMKILSGSLPKDSGRIFIFGEEIRHLTPERAQRLGIAMVYQEFSLVPSLSVGENIFLGQYPRNQLRLIDWPEIHRRSKHSFAELGVDIDPRAEVRHLSVAEQHSSTSGAGSGNNLYLSSPG